MTISKARLKELATRDDNEIDYSDIPELTEDFWKNAVLVEADKIQAVTLRVKNQFSILIKALAKATKPE